MTAASSRMERSSGLRRNHVRIVGPPDLNVPAALVDPTNRREIVKLTQQLVDALIEMVDLAHGDPDLEPNGDEFEPNGDEFEPDGDEFEDDRL